VRAAVVIVAVALIAASCGGDESASGADVTVFAAASLTAAFTELGDAFVSTRPDARVRFNFAGSSELVAQIRDGAPADVFASADETNMEKLADAGAGDGEPAVFATNAAEIIVESGNPKAIRTVRDLVDDDLLVVQCAVEVPCGAYADQVFATAGVDVEPRSFEANVNAVVAKVVLGEADAGIVYRTDVLAAGDRADGVVVPDEINVMAQYPIAVTANARNPAAAREFVDFVLGGAGQEILATYGFGAP
jgi:molybdate transport system substrate-binding protein